MLDAAHGRAGARRWSSPPPPTTRSAQELHTTQVPDHRLLRAAHGAGRGDPRASPAARVAARLHGVGDIKRYNARMAGHRVRHRARRRAEPARRWTRRTSILIAPSRCGKTPTTMYLALQHGLFVANYPLVDEDFETTDLPAADPAPARPVLRADRRRRRGSAEVRQRAPPELDATPRSSSAPTSCAGPRRCIAANRLPVINSSTKSVEEMSAVILQTLQLSQRPTDHRDARRAR